MEWKTFKIANFTNSKTKQSHWQVSDTGLVRVYTPHNETIRLAKQTLSGGHPGKRYYCLSGNDWKYVHRAVATAFLPNPQNYKTVDHIDNNRLNNHVSNLEWVSYAENNKRRSLQASICREQLKKEKLICAQ